MDASTLGWPADEGPVDVRRTHLSEVFLGRTRVLKRKRPVDLGFVDFRDRAARLAACEAEVALNRRMAPGVYLGVRTAEDGEPMVEMIRLADEDSLLARLERGEADPALIERVADRIAEFHRTQAGPGDARWGRFDGFAQNARDNFAQSLPLVGRAVHPDVFARARRATDDALDAQRALLEAREGRIRDGHGDLRLEHVYVRGDEIAVIDCIEFADRYRVSDVALDVAFLAMDLIVRGRRDLADVLLARWTERTGDAGAAPLWPLYVSYRSAVRAKVAGMTVADPTTAPDRLAAQLARARRHWLLAWSALAPPDERPALMGVGGRPGTGKTTVARALGERGWEVIRSDVVRKEGGAAVSYGDDARSKVYEDCFARAEELLFAGKRVIVDASFTQAAWRDALRAVGARWGVPVTLVRCTAPDDVVRARLRARTGDASDADEAVYDRVHWEERPGEALVEVDTTRPLAL